MELRRREERGLIRRLASFHAYIDEQTAAPSDLADRIALLPRGAGLGMTEEVAWALLLRAAGSVSPFTLVPADADSSATMPVGPCPQTRRVRAFLEVVPDWPRWLDYLETRPFGDAFTSYRAERVRYALTWFPHIHPDPALLESWNAGVALPESLVEGVARHVSGPWNCLGCRRVLVPPARLAAAAGPATGEWRTRVAVEGSERAFLLRCVDDDGWLRVFLQAENDDDLSPDAAFQLTVLFQDGNRVSKRIRPEAQALSGTNLGRLGEDGLEGVVGFSIVGTDSRIDGDRPGHRRIEDGAPTRGSERA